MQAVWSQILGLPLENIPMNRSFVSLGGDSVAAMKAVSILRGGISVKHLLLGKTIQELAAIGQTYASTHVQQHPSEERAEDLERQKAVVLETTHRIEQLYGDILQSLTAKAPGLKVQVEDAYACTPMQQAMLIGQAKTRDVYNIHYLAEIVPMPDECPGPTVHAERFQEAWQVVMDRHPAMRTIFVHGLEDTKQGALEQVVLRNVKADFVHLHTEKDEDMELLENYPFVSYELGGLPHRLTLLTCSSGKSFIRLELNHAMTDCGSFALMMYELALAYDEQLHGGLDSSPCKDFVRHVYDDPSRDTSLAYWREYLEGSQPSNLPCLLDKDIVATEAGCSTRKLESTVVHMPLSAEKVSEFCREQEVTVFHIFQVAWALVLNSYLNNDDVCFGYSTSGRDSPVAGIDTAVGTFINTLICRVGTDKSKSVLSLLKEVQAQTTVSLDHQHCWIADAQEGGKRQFNTIIAFQKAVVLDRKRTTFQVNQISVYDPSEVSTGAWTAVGMQRSSC